MTFGNLSKVAGITTESYGQGSQNLSYTLDKHRGIGRVSCPPVTRWMVFLRPRWNPTRSRCVIVGLGFAFLLDTPLSIDTVRLFSTPSDVSQKSSTQESQRGATTDPPHLDSAFEEVSSSHLHQSQMPPPKRKGFNAFVKSTFRGFSGRLPKPARGEGDRS